MASRIQTGLVPPEGHLLQTGHTRALSYYHPHAEVGGDYFDVLNLSDDCIGFCIADVSGKGIAAALLMSNFQAMVRSLFTADVDLAHLTEDLNKRVGQNSHSEKFITMFIARYDCRSGELSYVNAAHLPPVVYQDGRLEELMTGCIGLGMLDEMPGVEVGRMHMSKGALLVAYTDGLVEVELDGHVESNSDSLMDIMRMGYGIDRTMKEIAKMAEAMRKQGKSFDDTSVLAIEFTSNPPLG